MHKLTPAEKLTVNLTNGIRMNLHKWDEGIVEYYIKKQYIDDRTYLDTIKDKFYMELHDGF
jgi:hypothetical protein